MGKDGRRGSVSITIIERKFTREDGEAGGERGRSEEGDEKRENV
jgi:hypothetical protein